MIESTSRHMLTDSAKQQLTSTDSGDFWTASAIKLDADVPQGSMIIALMDNGSYGNVWVLLYEQGGDWTAFGDGEEFNIEALHDWMPPAINHAVKEVADLPFLDVERVLADLEWFSDWSESAQSTLESK